MDLAPTICTQGLTRRFGDLVAVDNVDLRVAPGQFFGFLGPNGAGKSTTIKMLTGLLAPSSGRIDILGIDLNAHPVDVKRQIGVVPEGMALFGRLTGAEFLSFAGRMYGLDRVTAAQRAAELLDFMQLADQPKKLVTDYSHGMQKKLALAAAVIHGPKVLFLDEPFEGVDAIAAGTLKTMLQGMITRGAPVQPRRHHSSGTPGGPRLPRGVARRSPSPTQIHAGRRHLVRREINAGANLPQHRRRLAPHRTGAFLAGVMASLGFAD
jgi:ABC-2 type transport system ATP-binding protein